MTPVATKGSADAAIRELAALRIPHSHAAGLLEDARHSGTSTLTEAEADITATYSTRHGYRITVKPVTRG